MKIGKFLLVMMLLAATPLMAQQVGFRVGLAPGAFGYPQQAPTVVPVQVISVPVVVGYPAPRTQPVAVNPAFNAGFNTGFNTGFNVSFGAPYYPYYPSQQQVIVPGGYIVQQPAVYVQQPAVYVQQPAIFVQQPVYVPQPAVFVQQPAVFVQQPAVFVQQAPPQVSYGFRPIVSRRPEIGTPRERVIRELGPPTASVLTRDGETLYFRDGISVFFQNGQVAGPR